MPIKPVQITHTFFEAHYKKYKVLWCRTVFLFFRCRCTKLCEVKDDGVLVADKNGMQYKIDADSVILSTGYKSAPLAPKAKNVHIIGDADKVGNLRTVIWGAWDVCMKL